MVGCFAFCCNCMFMVVACLGVFRVLLLLTVAWLFVLLIICCLIALVCFGLFGCF